MPPHRRRLGPMRQPKRMVATTLGVMAVVVIGAAQKPQCFEKLRNTRVELENSIAANRKEHNAMLGQKAQVSQCNYDFENYRNTVAGQLRDLQEKLRIQNKAMFNKDNELVRCFKAKEDLIDRAHDAAEKDGGGLCEDATREAEALRVLLSACEEEKSRCKLLGGVKSGGQCGPLLVALSGAEEAAKVSEKKIKELEEKLLSLPTKKSECPDCRDMCEDCSRVAKEAAAKAREGVMASKWARISSAMREGGTVFGVDGGEGDGEGGVSLAEYSEMLRELEEARARIEIEEERRMEATERAHKVEIGQDNAYSLWHTCQRQLDNEVAARSAAEKQVDEVRDEQTESEEGLKDMTREMESIRAMSDASLSYIRSLEALIIDPSAAEITEAAAVVFYAKIPEMADHRNEVMEMVAGLSAKTKEKWNAGVSSWIPESWMTVVGGCLTYGIMLIPLLVTLFMTTDVKVSLRFSAVLRFCHTYFLAMTSGCLIFSLLINVDPLILVQLKAEGAYLFMHVVLGMMFLAYLALQGASVFYALGPRQARVIQLLGLQVLGVLYYLFIWRNAMQGMPPGKIFHDYISLPYLIPVAMMGVILALEHLYISPQSAEGQASVSSKLSLMVHALEEGLDSSTAIKQDRQVAPTVPSTAKAD